MGAVSTPSLFIATPCYGGQTTSAFTTSCVELTALANSLGVPLELHTATNHPLVHLARNQLVKRFLQSDCSHLFFIDADIGYRADDVFRLVAADKDVIAGAYPLKTIDWASVRKALSINPNMSDAQLESCAMTFTASAHLLTSPVGVPVECRRAPTGFMCIRRRVLEKLAEISGVCSDGAGGGGAFYPIFDTPITDGVFLPEDYAFCDRARAAGFKVWLDSTVALTHYGNYPFRGHLPTRWATTQGRLDTPATNAAAT